MKRRDSEKIVINVNNSVADNHQNNLVKLSFILMAFAFLVEIVFFAISVVNNDGFSGGMVASIFCVGYMVSAYLIIRKNVDSTFISLLYLVMIYATPSCWMGAWYIIIRNYATIYDYVQFITCLAAIALAVCGIVNYYRNNLKLASIFGLVSMIISIVGIILGGTAEMYKCILENMAYAPLIGFGFFLEAGVGVLPLIYLFKTL